MPSSHERNVQASRRNDRRNDERKADLVSREMAQKEQDRHLEQSARQTNEARFFAIEDHKDAPVDSRQQVRVMRERVRQTYVEQENRAARDAIHERQAQDAQAEQRAQQHNAQQPIDLIA
ncbi:hypothetical protein MNBD_GAMMA24-1028 [hydrothermal vent metagenome]|uniref:Uncharacterized protein n=1 Tax=hydrothermal vent metagenome TaxID=652676 RepID=A0A3B1C6R8_9ZZZZ